MIPFPPEEVAAYAGDPTNAHEWYANMHPVNWRTPPPTALGSKMDFKARFLGRIIAYTYEVVDLEPGRRLVMRTSDGPFPWRPPTTGSGCSAGPG